MSGDGGRSDLAPTWTAATADTPGTTAAPSGAPAGPLQIRDRARYEVTGEQGRGGLGVVMRARDHELGRDVAIKELIQRGHASELRFFREALVTARLEHPGIVPVHEAGRWPDGTPFYTMKLVGGRSLKAHLEAASTPAERLALIPNVIAVADAIAYAHDHRIIHRDLKPANVMIGDFGETIVIDWGLAKSLDDAEPGEPEGPYRSAARHDLTAHGSVLGTPAYMAPEQHAGAADHRSDLYALGGILYHLISGRPPHTESEPGAGEPPELPRQTSPDLAAIVRRAMHPDPARRYPTARALADDLRRYGRRERVGARRYSVPARLALGFARHRGVAVISLAALVVLSATLAISLYRITRERDRVARAREDAVISNATVLLERDPTRAWQVLAGVAATPEAELLRARLRAAGVADRVVPIPARFEARQLAADGAHVVVATDDRRLRVLDLTTAEVGELADGVVDPTMWATAGDRVYYLRRSPELTIAARPVSGGAATEIARVTTGAPTDVEASALGVLWLTDDGTLSAAGPGEPARTVARDVRSFVVAGARVAVCGGDGRLRVGGLAARNTDAGTCGDGPYVAGPDGFVYPAGDGTFTIDRAGVLDRGVAGADLTRIVRISATGLVAGASVDGDGLVWRPGARAPERVHLPVEPAQVEIRDDLVAWALRDGSVYVRDTATGREWSLVTHPEAAWSVLLLPGERLLTAVRRELRMWSLAASTARRVAELPMPANHLAFDASGAALLDATDGHAFLITPGADRAVALHQHELYALGVGWCDGEACSAGADGRVLCTDVAAGTTRVVADLRADAWLTARDGRCLGATTTGVVVDVRAPTAPRFALGQEPRQLVIAPGGRQVAIDDSAGAVTTYDLDRATVIGRPGPGAGEAVALAWADDHLVVATSDGRVELRTPALAVIRAWHLPAAVSHLATAGSTIAGDLGDGVLWIASARGDRERRLATGAAFTAVVVGRDGSVAAGTSTGEVLVVDPIGAIRATRLEHGRVSCLGFAPDGSLTACSVSGRVVTIPETMSRRTSTPGGPP